MSSVVGLVSTDGSTLSRWMSDTVATEDFPDLEPSINPSINGKSGERVV